MAETVTIAARFRGPPASGNGGYSAGLAAKALGGASAEITLLAPPPLDTPLAVVRDGAEIALAHGDREIVRARPGSLDFDVPPTPSFAQAEAAARGYMGLAAHAFPGCFVCGPERGEGDGLRIFAGPLEGAPGVVAAPWIPGGDLADEDGLVAGEFLWAALDCPSYFALPRAGSLPALLGRITAEIIARARPGERLVAAAWAVGAEGRKHTAQSAVYGQDGALLARASCLWIELKTQAP